MTPRPPTQMPPGTLSDNVGKHDEHPVNDATHEDAEERNPREKEPDSDSDD